MSGQGGDNFTAFLVVYSSILRGRDGLHIFVRTSLSYIGIATTVVAAGIGTSA